MKNQALAAKLRNAVSGLVFAWRNEDNLRRHGLFALAAMAVFLWLQPAWLWWGLIVLCIGLVFAAELLNSALEILIDQLHPETHPAIGQVKDVLAGMVLVISLVAATVGILAVIDSL